LIVSPGPVEAAVALSAGHKMKKEASVRRTGTEALSVISTQVAAAAALAVSRQLFTIVILTPRISPLELI
jgi:hypothetical protein